MLHQSLLINYTKYYAVMSLNYLYKIVYEARLYQRFLKSEDI